MQPWCARRYIVRAATRFPNTGSGTWNDAWWSFSSKVLEVMAACRQPGGVYLDFTRHKHAGHGWGWTHGVVRKMSLLIPVNKVQKNPPNPDPLMQRKREKIDCTNNESIEGRCAGDGKKEACFSSFNSGTNGKNPQNEKMPSHPQLLMGEAKKWWKKRSTAKRRDFDRWQEFQCVKQILISFPIQSAQWQALKPKFYLLDLYI